MLAAVARVQLSRFDDMQARRLQLVGHYRRLLEGIESVRPLPECQRAHSANHLMVVTLPEDVDRDQLQDAMTARGIGTSVHFQPLHTFGWFHRQGFASGPTGTPVADSLMNRVLSLPLHTMMDTGDVERVCQTLDEVLADLRGV